MAEVFLQKVSELLLQQGHSLPLNWPIIQAYRGFPGISFPASIDEKRGLSAIFDSSAMAQIIYNILFIQIHTSGIEAQAGSIEVKNQEILFPRGFGPRSRHTLILCDLSISANGHREQKEDADIKPYVCIPWDDHDPFLIIAAPIQDIVSDPLWLFHQALLNRILAREIQQGEKEAIAKALWALAVIKSLIEVNLNHAFIVDAIAAFQADLKLGAYFKQGEAADGEPHYFRQRNSRSQFMVYSNATRNAKEGDEDKGLLLRTSKVNVLQHSPAQLNYDLADINDEAGLRQYLGSYIDVWEAIKAFRDDQQADCLDAFIDNIKIDVASDSVNVRSRIAIQTMRDEVHAINARELHRKHLVKKLKPIALLIKNEQSYSVASVETEFNRLLEKYQGYAFYENRMDSGEYIEDREQDRRCEVNREQMREEIVSHLALLCGEQRDRIDRKWPLFVRKEIPNDGERQHRAAVQQDDTVATLQAQLQLYAQAVERAQQQNGQLRQQHSMELQQLQQQHSAQLQEEVGLAAEEARRHTSSLLQHEHATQLSQIQAQRAQLEQEKQQALFELQQQKTAYEALQQQQYQQYSTQLQEQLQHRQQQYQTTLHQQLQHQQQQHDAHLQTWQEQKAREVQQLRGENQTLRIQLQHWQQRNAELEAQVNLIQAQQPQQLQNERNAAPVDAQKKPLQIPATIDQLKTVYLDYQNHLNDSYEVDDSLLNHKKQIVQRLLDALNSKQGSMSDQQIREFILLYNQHKEHLEKNRDNIGTHLLKTIASLMATLLFLVPPARKYFLERATQVEGQKVIRRTDNILLRQH